LLLENHFDRPWALYLARSNTKTAMSEVPKKKAVLRRSEMHVVAGRVVYLAR